MTCLHPPIQLPCHGKPRSFYSRQFQTTQVFPTDVRAFFHGISAAAGKLGAIIAATVFTRVGARMGCYHHMHILKCCPEALSGTACCPAAGLAAGMQA